MYGMQIEGNAFVVECDNFWVDKEIMPRPVYQHTGRHMQNIIRTLEDPLWPGIVQRLAIVLKGVDISKKTKLSFLFACHTGKHRSASVAEAVNMILLYHMFFRSGVDHTQYRGCRCGECSWPQPEPNHELLAVAIRSWKNNAPP